jgi:FHS family L-fucose permease-like MFS transporter
VRIFLSTSLNYIIIMEETPARRNESVVSAAAAQVIANDRKRKAIDDHAVTGAGEITVRQSIVPVSLVTVLFFMWGFAY